jgi:hypothetical protein
MFKEKAILSLRVIAPPPFLPSYDSLFSISPVFTLKGRAVSGSFKLKQHTAWPKILSCGFWPTSHFQFLTPKWHEPPISWRVFQSFKGADYVPLSKPPKPSPFFQ